MPGFFRKFFLSLKWQAVLGVTLILICGIGLITFFGKKNMETTYVNERIRVFEDRHQAILGALQSMQVQLLQLSSHMQGLAQGVAANDPENQYPLRTVLNQNWGLLNFEWGVDYAAIFDSKLDKMSSWGAAPINSADTRNWLEKSGQLEKPIYEVWCNETCWQLVVVPVLNDQSSTHVLMFAQSLANAVLHFQSNTAVDVGILVSRSETRSSVTESINQLENWQRDVIALTGIPTTLRVLNSASQSIPLKQLKLDRSLQTLDGNHYEVSLIPLTSAGNAKEASLVIIEDITLDMFKLQSTLTNFIIAAAITLLLAEAVLLWLLWRPMGRLQEVASALPLLVQDARDKHHFSLQPIREPRLVRNEIHHLFDAAISLSRRLEHLDTTVKFRTKGLKQRSRELLEERNFVTSLLNNVHVTILTQDEHGIIQLLNTEGRKLLELDDRASVNLNFTEFLDRDTKAAIDQNIKNLFLGKAQSYHHECFFHSPGDHTRYMEWFHSLLPKIESQDSLVLSVGLDLTARKTAEQDVAWLADHDPLTELYNRRRFQKEFNKALQKADRSDQPGALIFLDVDQFKTVNDTSGHLAGDRLLCDLSKILLREVRNTDTLARLGGDEFAILLEHTSEEGAISFAKKLCDIASDLVIADNDNSYRVTISIGISLYPEQGDTIEELMANADLAMYKAKNKGNGHSNWHIYSTDAPEKQELKHTLGWKSRIEQALDKERFVLYYQPILDIAQNKVSHYEALVRMIDEQGDIVPPGLFIPVAEKTGLIYDIDRYVIELAVSNLKAFHSQGREITLSVNLSAKAIAKTHFISTIESLVEKHGINRSHLIFELTETSAVEDIVTAADVIGRCRKLGYKFALDDFGVGFASWFCPRQLPVDYVKIDGSFVRDLGNNYEDRLFVKAINDVAQGLGKRTIAEFVEDSSSLELLAEYGVDYAQGYYVGKPVSRLPKDSTVVDFPQLNNLGQANNH